MTLLAALVSLSLVACGPMDSQLDPAAPATASQTQAAQGGGGRFQIGASDLFYNPSPTTGEVSFSNWVIVNPSPADTVVTLNGVPLIRDLALNGLYWKVNPAGPQPKVGSNGQLVVAASSASMKVSRTLTLPCAGDEAIVANPSEGSSLRGLSSMTLSWNASLTSHDISIPVQEVTNVTLYGYDPASGVRGAPVSMVYSAGVTGTSVAVGPTPSHAYRLEVRWPGQYILDGQSGGQCGRVKALTFGN